MTLTMVSFADISRSVIAPFDPTESTLLRRASYNLALNDEALLVIEASALIELQIVSSSFKVLLQPNVFWPSADGRLVD